MREELILIVESRNAGSSSLGLALQGKYRFASAFSGTEAITWITDTQPSLVVYDAVSLRSSGVRTCRRLRKAVGGDVPIIHCRGANQVIDRAACADVYLIHPFTARKLLNRIRALLPADAMKEEIVRAGELTFYLTKRSVDLAGQGERRLTPKLAMLLKQFLCYPNQVLERQELMKSVWETSYLGDTRTLDVHIRWLREVIESEPANPKIIRTVRGVGYIFNVPDKN